MQGMTFAITFPSATGFQGEGRRTISVAERGAGLPPGSDGEGQQSRGRSGSVRSGQAPIGIRTAESRHPLRNHGPKGFSLALRRGTVHAPSSFVVPGPRSSVVTDALPVVYLARHGETAWTISHQHTGLTDLPLTPNGETQARRLGARLEGRKLAAVFTSRLQRAVRTAELAGFGRVAQVDPDLVEWNYGAHEGRTTAEILAARPRWQLL